MTAYIHFSEEQKLRAGSVDLVEFLARRGEKLLRSGNDKRLASDKSITVRGGGWYDHAAERGGNAISFVREFYGYSYPGAVLLLLADEQGEAYKPAEQKPSSQERKPFVLPDANSDMRRVYAYLLKQRHIDRDVHFAREKTIFEDAEPHNAVFVGCDENGVPRHAHKKSTSTFGGGLSAVASISPAAKPPVPLNAPPERSSIKRPSNFRINVEGCDPAYSFHHIGTNEKLYVFEAPIDMLSFISLYQKNWEQHSYVSLCGVSEHAMLKMLELYPHLQNVVLCLDHDAAGIGNCQRLTDILSEHGYSDVGILQSEFKDWNEDIKALRGLESVPAEKHPQLEVCGEIFSQIADRMATTKADCSLRGLRILFEQIPIHLHSGRFDAADQCLESMAAVSLLLVQKQGRHMEQSVPSGQLISEMQNGFKPYQNKGKFQSRMDDIKQELIRIDAMQGVVTELQKSSSWIATKTLRSPVLRRSSYLRSDGKNRSRVLIKI